LNPDRRGGAASGRRGGAVFAVGCALAIDHLHLPGQPACGGLLPVDLDDSSRGYPRRSARRDRPLSGSRRCSLLQHGIHPRQRPAAHRRAGPSLPLVWLVYRSWLVSRSESCAARTVLAAGGGCFPVDRHALWWVCRWAGTAVPATVVAVTLRPGRWCAHTRPLSGAGSCRPSPDRQAEATSADRGRRRVMSGDAGRIGSLLLQWSAPVLGAPCAGVGGIHPDDSDSAACRHGD
jgi:hypothetical protein